MVFSWLLIKPIRAWRGHVILTTRFLVDRSTHKDTGEDPITGVLDLENRSLPQTTTCSRWIIKSGEAPVHGYGPLNIQDHPTEHGEGKNKKEGFAWFY